MLKNMLASGLFAGVCAGLLGALLQLWLVQPVLLEAEEYESGARIHFAGVAEHGAEAGGHDHAAHDHGNHDGADAGAPSNLTRNALSVLFSILLYSAFGLMLVAAMSLAATRFGADVDARSGLLWGIGGWVAVQMAPAMGLAPELPGSAAADLVARQIWWFSTVAVTAAGLWLCAFGRGMAQLALGIALIAAPHAIGAPHPEAWGGVAPPELAAEFAARALGTGLAAWAVLGMAAGHFWQRFMRG